MYLNILAFEETDSQWYLLCLGVGQDKVWEERRQAAVLKVAVVYVITPF